MGFYIHLNIIPFWLFGFIYVIISLLRPSCEVIHGTLDDIFPWGVRATGCWTSSGQSVMIHVMIGVGFRGIRWYLKCLLMALFIWFVMPVASTSATSILKRTRGQSCMRKFSLWSCLVDDLGSRVCHVMKQNKRILGMVSLYNCVVQSPNQTLAYNWILRMFLFISNPYITG